MLREEEDDMTQEMRQFVVFSIDNEIKKLIENASESGIHIEFQAKIGFQENGARERNLKILKDLQSGMCNRDIKEKYNISATTLSTIKKEYKKQAEILS